MRAGLDLWQAGAPFGTYNLTNPGYVTTREVVALLRRHLAPKRDFSFFTSDAEFYATAAKTPRSNCVLDSQKAIAAGARLPEVGEALEEAVTSWTSR